MEAPTTPPPTMAISAFCIRSSSLTEDTLESRPMKPILAALLFLSVQSETYDPFGLLEPKDFAAYRSSSNNPNLASNDDSKRPIPGETTVLADLEGPGVVTHL